MSEKEALVAVLGLAATAAAGVGGWLKVHADARIKQQVAARKQAAAADAAAKHREEQRLAAEEARLVAERQHLDQMAASLWAKLYSEVERLQGQLADLREELEQTTQERDDLRARVRVLERMNGVQG